MNRRENISPSGTPPSRTEWGGGNFNTTHGAPLTVVPNADPYFGTVVLEIQHLVGSGGGFGLDNLSEESPDTPTTWDELAWEHLADFASLGRVDFDVNVPDDTAITSTPDSQFEWGRNAADMAYILYQVPVMVAFHAADMLS